MEQIQFIQTSPEQLKNELTEAVRQELSGIKEHLQPKEPTEYLTRAEVVNWLKIDLSTLYHWTKRGKLKSYGIGNRVYYKRSEVEAAIIPLSK